MTKLLISPKGIEEARAAYRGNAEIIDVKNPREGSLGANFPWIISQIRDEIPSEIPISAAIGDFPNLPGTASLAALGALEAGANIIKVGLKGPKKAEEAVYLMRQVVKAVGENSQPAEVVACAYGDFERAGTIDPRDLPEIGQSAEVDYVMMDTAIKDGKPLTDFFSMDELRDFVDEAHSLDLKVALAGSLGREQIFRLKNLDPDVIGVRGAVCEGNNRGNEISEDLVRELTDVLED